jgi:DNA-binding transcriptional regulator YdaS (Cro superfamily)
VRKQLLIAFGVLVLGSSVAFASPRGVAEPFQPAAGAAVSAGAATAGPAVERAAGGSGAAERFHGREEPLQPEH